MELKKRIIEIIAKNYDLEDVNYLHENDDLTQLDMDSISFIKMVIEMENEFGFEFEDEKLDYNKFTSLDLLQTYIEDMMRMNNIAYSLAEKIIEKTAYEIKEEIIQMISTLIDISTLHSKSFSDLSLFITLEDAQYLIKNINQKYNISISEEIVRQKNLYILDNLCTHIFDILNDNT